MDVGDLGKTLMVFLEHPFNAVQRLRARLGLVRKGAHEV